MSAGVVIKELGNVSDKLFITDILLIVHLQKKKEKKLLQTILPKDILLPKPKFCFPVVAICLEIMETVRQCKLTFKYNKVNNLFIIIIADVEDGWVLGWLILLAILYLQCNRDIG